MTSSNSESIHAQIAQHQSKQILNWINQQILKKSITSISSFDQLSSGTIFLQIISIYHPKKVDLSKTFMKPKDQYEVLQNYKQLLIAFTKLGWKKFDPQKYRKKKQKDYQIMANFLKKTLSQHIFNGQTPPSAAKVHNILTKTKDLSPKIVSSPKKYDQKKKMLLKDQQKIQKQKTQHSITQKNITNKMSFNKFISQNNTVQQNFYPPNSSMKKSKVLLTHQRGSSLLSQNLYEQKLYSPQIQYLQKQEQDYQNFKNVKITKLQKQKAYLLKNLMKIQNLLMRQKKKENLNKKQDLAKDQIISNRNKQNQSQNQDKDKLIEKQKTQTLRNKLTSIISEIII